jgi:RNA 2',3'-cyclic 3'-phosphodiesterase
MRLFFAIELPPPPREHLLRVMDAARILALRASWTRPQNLHLTLRFLGEVPDAQTPPVCELGRNLARPGALRLACDELVFLPSAERARVISVGLGGDMAPLMRFQGEIEAACRQLGYVAEVRPYAAHITLARLRERISVGVLEQLQRQAAGMFPGPEFWIRHVALMQSIQDRNGVIYSPVAHWEL